MKLSFLYDFLPYKPGAPHPVASAPLKAQMCFCLSPQGAEKFKPPAPRVVVDFFINQFGYPLMMTKTLTDAEYFPRNVNFFLFHGNL